MRFRGADKNMIARPIATSLAGGVDGALDLLDRLVERGERRAALVSGQAFGGDRAEGARGSEILAAHAAERVLDRGLLLVVGDLGRRLLDLVHGRVDVPGRDQERVLEAL